ncbi:hypothetical protein, partial [Klebsiella pneumoniae]|uniref:hypothetical protein n=1 Tax=Klebsiella pneumoniae TaxID=573 RepID=UPI0019D6E227
SHSDPFFPQPLEARPPVRPSIAVCCKVVDFPLTFFKPRLILSQHYGLRGPIGIGGRETHEFEERFSVTSIFRRALLNHQA